MAKPADHHINKWLYLLAYTAPASALAGLLLRGWFSPGAMYIGFLVIPMVESLWFKSPEINSEPVERPSSKLFDWFLYLHLPVLYGIIIWYLYLLIHKTITPAEHVGLALNVGLILGTSGINIGHELGHRREGYHHVLAWLFLLPALYLHFYIEHNKGHHRNIATTEDPATALKGETIYAFWLRSVCQSYLHAWKIQLDEIRLKQIPFLSIKNTMLVFLIASILYLATIVLFFSWFAAMMALVVAIIGVLFLESVNYIEHYGLSRNSEKDGSPEHIHEGLSWDAEQPLGRIFLYELTRHADHHTHANLPYHALSPKKQSPKLPWGYPAAILHALIPPWWFGVMHRQGAFR